MTEGAGTFVRICSKGQLPPSGEALEFSAGGKLLCVANLNGAISAMDNECPHHGGPLGQGMIEEGKIVCPWHAYAYDVVTGISSHDSGLKVDVYEVKLAGDDVLVKL